jgi:DNA-binding GntR family transcriptional regulator
MGNPEHVEYRRIANEIAGKIASGELAAHTKLPSTRELAEQYGVSMSTVFRAVALLRDRGLVYGQTGKGVYVSGPRT